MEGVYIWIKGIAFYLILILAIQNVIPDNKYKKYIKLFSGMLLVLLVISPITNVFNFTENIANLYEDKLVKQEIGQMEVQLSNMEDSVYEATINQYKELVKEQVSVFAEDEGLYIEEFSCEITDDAQLSSITLILSKETTDADSNKVYVDKIRINSKEELGISNQVEDISVINLKKSIVDFYNISDDNINISIR